MRIPYVQRKHKLGLFLATALLWAPLGFPAPAHALASRSVLVLNIADDGHPKEALRSEVSELLRRAGARLVDTPRLPAADRNCQESRCLNKLAEEHRVDLILAASIEHHGAHDRIINMWLYDAGSGKDQSERQVCDARDVAERLRELAGRLIGPQLQDEPPPAPSPPTVVTAPPPPPVVPSEPARRLSSKEPSTAAAPKVLAVRASSVATSPVKLARWRIGLAAGLGSLALGSLAAAIGMQRLTSQPSNSGGCKNDHGGPTDCAYSLTAAFVPSYVAAGALAVGSILTVTLPSSKEVRR